MGRGGGGGRSVTAIFINIHRWKSHRIPDHIDNTFKILKNIHIPKSYHPKTALLEFTRPPFISSNVFRPTMLPTVKFNHQFAVITGKVSNKSSNWNLPAKVAVFDFKQTNLLPELALGGCCIITQFPRQLVCHRATPTPSPSPQGGGRFSKQYLPSIHPRLGLDVINVV